MRSPASSFPAGCFRQVGCYHQPADQVAQYCPPSSEPPPPPSPPPWPCPSPPAAGLFGGELVLGVHLHFHDDRQLLGTKTDELLQSLGEILKLWVSFALVGTLCLHYSLVEAGRSHHQAGEVVDGEVEEPGILHHRLENLHLLHFWILHPLLGIRDQDVLLPTSTQLFGFAPDVGKKARQTC